MHYIHERFRHGLDRELEKLTTLKLTEEEALKSKEIGAVADVVGRQLRGKMMWYELKKNGKTMLRDGKLKDADPVWNTELAGSAVCPRTDYRSMRRVDPHASDPRVTPGVVPRLGPSPNPDPNPNTRCGTPSRT